MQLVIASLLGLTNAATPGPMPSTSFPKFDTVVVPTVTGGSGNGFLDSDSAIDATFYYPKAAATAITVGPVRGYRNDLTVFPTQALVASTTASTGGTVTAQTATRTFWQTTAALVGSRAAKGTVATPTTQSTGPTWTTCLTTTTILVCNGGASSEVPASGTPKGMATTARIAMKVSNAGTSI
jgi:hypothetical protein